MGVCLHEGMNHSQPRLEPAGELPDGTPLWRTAEELVLYLPLRQPIIIPQGYLTDLASVPRFLRALIPNGGYHTRAAIAHDYVIEHWAHLISRAEADALFDTIMREDFGVAVNNYRYELRRNGASEEAVAKEAQSYENRLWWRRKAMWLAVRLFNHNGYERAKKRREYAERRAPDGEPHQ